jgi:hypothetical protein
MMSQGSRGGRPCLSRALAERRQQSKRFDSVFKPKLQQKNNLTFLSDPTENGKFQHLVTIWEDLSG